MHSHRDYFLQHLGIGEIWQLRDAEPLHAVSEKDHEPQHEVQKSDNSKDTFEALRRAVQQCTACSLCSTQGRRADSFSEAQVEIVMLVDWSEHEQFELELGLQFERLVKNIAMAAQQLGLNLQIVPLLQSAMPTKSLALPLSESMFGCGPLVQRYVELLQVKQILVFGTRCASALGLQSGGEGASGMHAAVTVPTIMFPSIFELLQDGELKRVVWQQLCKLAVR